MPSRIDETYQGLWLPSRGALGGKSKNETVPGGNYTKYPFET